jgi:hypothetical protein
MKKLIVLVALIAMPAAALESGDCARLASLYEIRSLMMKRYSSSYEVGEVISRRLADLRQGYVVYVRHNSGSPIDKKVHKLRGGDGSDVFESESDHVFEVKIVVPSKRSMFNANYPVSVATATINYTVNGRQKTRTEHIDATMNPDTSRTFDLGAIADHVRVAVDSKGRGDAVIETHFVQATAEDDPANPNYATIESLRRLGTSPSAMTVDDEIASVESRMFPKSDPLPLLQIVEDLRKAEELIRSKKTDDQEKGDRLLRETLRRLR